MRLSLSIKYRIKKNHSKPWKNKSSCIQSFHFVRNMYIIECHRIHDVKTIKTIDIRDIVIIKLLQDMSESKASTTTGEPDPRGHRDSRRSIAYTPRSLVTMSSLAVRNAVGVGPRVVEISRSPSGNFLNASEHGDRHEPISFRALARSLVSLGIVRAYVRPMHTCTESGTVAFLPRSLVDLLTLRDPRILLVSVRRSILNRSVESAARGRTQRDTGQFVFALRES